MIRSIDIKAFRGIPQNLSLDFTDSNGHAISAIIYGENGSGKSSITDALEFVLQGKIGRSDKINNPLRPSVRTFTSKIPQGSEITVVFEDGESYTREIRVEMKDGDYPRLKSYPSDSHSSFLQVPVILRRNDIIAYNYIEESQRQVLFFSFLYDLKGSVKNDNDPEIISLRDDLLILKNSRRELFEKIAKCPYISIDSIEQMSHDQTLMMKYINNRIVSRSYKNKTGYLKPHMHIVSDQSYNNIKRYTFDLAGITQQIRAINANIRNKKAINNDSKRIFANLASILKDASIFLSDSFKAIANINYIQSISLSVANISVASLNIKIKLVNGVQTSPNLIFSEANFDLMILLLYISIIRLGVLKGQHKFLILDDVLQSVDSSIRVKFIDYLLLNMPDWQFIFTCHDRLWLNQIKYLFNRRGHQFKEFHINSWDFLAGPTVQEKKYEIKDATLSTALHTNNMRIIAATCGFLLEKICQKLSVNLPTSVKRRDDEKYTIGDLWGGIKKIMSKTEVKDLIDQIDQLLFIRNLLGCHYNEWAESLSDSEVKQFAKTIQELYDKTFCEKCNTWISLTNLKNPVAECRCRHMSLNKV